MGKFKRVVAVQDDDSHWYIIPIRLEELFYDYLADGEKDEYTEFMDKFSEYMTGGDINLVPLYIKEDEQG